MTPVFHSCFHCSSPADYEHIGCPIGKKFCLKVYKLVQRGGHSCACGEILYKEKIQKIDSLSADDLESQLLDGIDPESRCSRNELIVLVCTIAIVAGGVTGLTLFLSS